jgi:Protein of unknown function (DUF3168)
MTMASAAWALQRAIHETLTTDAAVLAALGGARVHDDVPRGAELPYVTVGQSSARDWSTGTDDGEEHTLTLHVWSRANGRRQVQEIMAVVRAALNQAGLSLSGHRLVNLRQEFAEARRDPDGETYHGMLRFRAVTEPV